MTVSPHEPDETAADKPDADLAEQQTEAWPDPDDEGVVPDADRVVPVVDDED